jgi:hypothetical protein
MPLKDETILAIGMFSLSIGILIGKFLYFEIGGVSVTDFLEGLLIGLSLLMNLTYLIKIRNSRKAELE